MSEITFTLSTSQNNLSISWGLYKNLMLELIYTSYKYFMHLRYIKNLQRSNKENWCRKWRQNKSGVLATKRQLS